MVLGFAVVILHVHLVRYVILNGSTAGSAFHIDDVDTMDGQEEDEDDHPLEVDKWDAKCHVDVFSLPATFPSHSMAITASPSELQIVRRLCQYYTLGRSLVW